MTPQFRHTAGDIWDGWGPVPLVRARALIRQWGLKAIALDKLGDRRALTYARAAAALSEAHAACCDWRRAAGWLNPDDADRHPPLRVPAARKLVAL